MGVAALIMAGGKGTRIKSDIEKPLIPILGQPMILHIINASKKAQLVDGIFVAVSPNTPKTSQRMKELRIKIVETLGKNYVADMQLAIKKLLLKKTMILSADLPLLDATLIDKIIRYYEVSGKPALTVMAPFESYQRLKLEPDLKMRINKRTLVPTGINFLDGTYIDKPEIEEELLIMKDLRILLNINTQNELKLAEKYFKTHIQTTDE